MAASATDKQLKRVMGKANLQVLRSLSHSHIEERREIKEMHKLEMQKFSRWWTGYFDYLNEREKRKVAKWQREQETEY